MTALDSVRSATAVDRLTPASLAFWAVVAALLVMTFAVRPGLFVDQFVGGLVYGASLVLIALGLSIILGLLGIVNFAHGALFMLGAYATYQLMAVWSVPFWAVLVLAPTLVGLFGLVIERLVLRRLYGEPPLTGLLATFGIALMIEEAARAIWGGVPLSVQMPTVLTRSTDLVVTAVARVRLFSVLVAAVAVLGVYLLIEWTDFGLSIRAGVLDREMAGFLGIDMPTRFAAMFFLGSFVAGLGGVLHGTAVGVNPGVGEQFIIITFVVVVVGGIGSLFGSVVSGVLIGEAVYLTPLVLTALAAVTDVEALAIPGIGGLVPYLVMILLLLLRPRGLFGREGFLE